MKTKEIDALREFIYWQLRDLKEDFLFVLQEDWSDRDFAMMTTKLEELSNKRIECIALKFWELQMCAEDF